jgi:hypothetical protein
MTQGVTATHSEEGSAIISLKEQLTAAVVYNFNQIRTAYGYNKNLYTVRDIQSYEKIQKFPFANVITRDEIYTEQGQDRWVKKTLGYTIDVFVRNVNKINNDIEDILADIEKRIYNNYVLPDYAGNRTCTECYITSNRPFGIESTQPAGGIQIMMDVFYRQDISNPALPSATVVTAGGFGAGGFGQNPFGY